MRMYDVLLVLLSEPPSQRNSVQSLRAWRCLARCREIDVRALYLVGARILERSRLHSDLSQAQLDTDGDHDEEEEEDERQERSQRAYLARAEWLKFTHAGKWQQVDKLSEWILSLAAGGKVETAIDELETFLPAHPYHDSIKLNTLAAHLVLLHAQTLADHAAPAVAARGDDSDDHNTARSDEIKNQVDNEADIQASSVDPGESRDDSLHHFIVHLAQSQPALVARAKDYFRQAHRLEQDLAGRGTGEAARWVAIMDAVSLALERRKRAESDD
ncbi:hypothetical protein OIV83_003221 [Microbotryomycetes sp. JL201]|nr:hypothetical protein OIV83_003221 [Microbotryomycetes sp. JL201]